MAKQIYIPTGGGQTLTGYIQADEPAGERTLTRTLIVMVHDFPGDKTGNNDLFADLQAVFAEKDMNSLRFDFRGCGESPEAHAAFSFAGACEDLQAVCEWARKGAFDSFIFIAEGLGASVVTAVAPSETAATAFLWPVLDPPSYIRHRYGACKTNKKGIVEAGDHVIALKTLNELKNLDLGAKLEKLREPVLVLHGVQDEIVPISQLDKARNKIKSSRIEITTFHDGQHGLQKMSQRKMLFYHLSQFIEKYT